MVELSAVEGILNVCSSETKYDCQLRFAPLDPRRVYLGRLLPPSSSPPLFLALALSALSLFSQNLFSQSFFSLALFELLKESKTRDASQSL